MGLDHLPHSFTHFALLACYEGIHQLCKQDIILVISWWFGVKITPQFRSKNLKSSKFTVESFLLCSFPFRLNFLFVSAVYLGLRFIQGFLKINLFLSQIFLFLQQFWTISEKIPIYRDFFLIQSKTIAEKKIHCQNTLGLILINP